MIGKQYPITKFSKNSLRLGSGQAVVVGIPPLRDKLSRRIGTSRPANIYFRRFQSDWPNHLTL